MVAGSAVLVMVRSGDAMALKVVDEGCESTAAPPPIGEPLAVAVLVTVPASTSAWVGVYSAVQVTVAPGAMEAAPAGQLGAGVVPVPVKAPSATEMSVSVTLPVFVTR